MEGIPLKSDGNGGGAEASFVIISPVKKLRTYPSPKKRQQLQQQQQLLSQQQQLLSQQQQQQCIILSQPVNFLVEQQVNWVVFNECCYRTFFSKCVTVSYLKLNV
jgi:hypothetical protein